MIGYFDVVIVTFITYHCLSLSMIHIVKCSDTLTGFLTPLPFPNSVTISDSHCLINLHSRNLQAFSVLNKLVIHGLSDVKTRWIS